VAVTPQRTLSLAPHILRAEPDLLVIQGTVVSAEHVSRQVEPLNLKDFIRHYEIPVVVGGCTSYQAALHLMRTGAAGVLVGAGSGAAGTTRRVLGVGIPMATAIADARAARMRHLDETGVYVHVIADGGMTTGGDIAKAVVCGADAVMVGTPLAAAAEAPGRGFHWVHTAAHATLPRGHRVPVEPRGTFEEILLGPAHEADGQRNLLGALRRSMALCGYETLKDFQKAEVVALG
jgi:IMP dehydrogenase